LNRSGVNRLIQVFAMVVLMGVALFVTAGRLDWVAAWVFLGLYVLGILTIGLWLLRKNPDLINERGQVKENTKKWDKVLVSLYTLMLLVMLVVSGLDAGRFGWSAMPIAVQVLGAIAFVAAMAWTCWTMLANPFLSAVVRIQEDRGHQVATSGPYRFVRHPMYAAMLLMWPSLPLILGSWWGLLPGLLIDIIFVIRTALEDRTLQAELPGYPEYAQLVHYRLIPKVW